MMIFFNPAIIALTAASLLVCTFTLYASGMGAHILYKWNLHSADESQLRLERKTYLISSILRHVLSIELVTLFMFIATADHLHKFFTGAMCAAGVLNANPMGKITLAVRLVSFLCCGIWLVVNHVDALTWDFPLIRFKYLVLLFIGPLLVAEGVLQMVFIAGLDPQVLTSCCGVLFSSASTTMMAEMAHLPPKMTAGQFYLGMIFNLGVGALFLKTGRKDWLYGLLSMVVFVLALLALISFFCFYVYEAPSHRCPYCMLQKEYRYVGYFLYASLLVGAICGGSVGVLGRFKKKLSLSVLIARVQQRLCWVSMLAYGIFTLKVTIPIVFGNFKLSGY